MHGTAMRYVALLIVAFSLVPIVHAAQPLEGVAAVVNNEVITFADVREITKKAEEKAARELSGDPLRTEIAKIRLTAIAKLVERKRAETGSVKSK
jgi:parvulin-like peptidyl-prolyl isomerase